MLNNGGDRVIATLGNPIYVSGYGLFLWLFGAYWYLKESGLWARRFAGMVSVLGFFGIFFGGTRGTLLAVVAVCVVLCVALLVQKHSIRARQIGAVVLVLICLFGVSLALFRTTSFVRSIPAVGRLASTSVHEALNSPRFMAWEVAVESFREYPVFGWGPNNFYYAFNQYYRPEFLRSGYGETWFDNAHNIVVNTLATQGVFGITVYVALFALFVSLLGIRFVRATTGRESVQWVLLLAFLVGHFVHNVFVFENPTSYLYFFFFLAFVVYLLGQPDVVLPTRLSRMSVNGGVCIGVTLVGLLAVFATNINPARANMSTLDLIREVNRGGDPILLFDTATAYPTPHIDDLRNDFGRTALAYAQAAGGTNKQKAISVLERAIDEAIQNTVVHPLDVRTFLLLAELYTKREALVMDGTSLPRSLVMLERAHELSPGRQQVIFALASLYQIAGDNERAIELYTQARNLDPVVTEGWWRLAYAYAYSGRSDEALSVVQEAEGKGIDLGEYKSFIEKETQK